MNVRWIYMVRHGQYVTDPEDARFGQLTALGRKQARKLGKRLAQGPAFDVMYSSDMPRAIETAEMIQGNLPAVRLRKSTLLREGIPSFAAHWPASLKPKVAEMRETKLRMQRAFEQHFKPTRGRDRHELYVVHGNIIRFLVRLALGDSSRGWSKLALRHCSLSVVGIRPFPPGPILVQLGDVGHFPNHFQTFE